MSNSRPPSPNPARSRRPNVSKGNSTVWRVGLNVSRCNVHAEASTRGLSSSISSRTTAARHVEAAKNQPEGEPVPTARQIIGTDSGQRSSKHEERDPRGLSWRILTRPQPHLLDRHRQSLRKLVGDARWLARHPSSLPTADCQGHEVREASVLNRGPVGVYDKRPSRFPHVPLVGARCCLAG